MEEKYKIFTKGFDKILELVELCDEEVINKYKSVIDLMPNNVVEAVRSSRDFEFDGNTQGVDFMRFENAVSLDYIRKKKYLRTEMYIHRIHDEDLLPKKIFSLTMRNTKLKKDDIRFFYVEKNGKLEFVGTNDKPEEKSLEFSWQVFLDYNDFGPVLECKKLFRGVEIWSKTTQLTFDELTQYFESEEKCGDDWEVEFDADFEI